MAKYRVVIARSSRKKKPPGRNVVNKETVVNSNIENIVNSDIDSSCSTPVVHIVNSEIDSSSSTPIVHIVNSNIDNSNSTPVDFSKTNIDQDTSTFSKKLKLDEEYIKENKSSTFTDKLEWCYLLFDTRILIDIVDTIGSCPSCSEKINFYHNINIKKGLAHFIELYCTKCDWNTSFATSKEVEKSMGGEIKSPGPGSGRNPYDINIRSVIAMREVGRGHTALKTLCGLMNIPAPMTQKTFLETQRNVSLKYIKSAEANMKSAADEVRKMDGGPEVAADEIVNTTISTDGTWQKRGFSSRNGVVTIVANHTGKCIDYRVKTKDCKACQYWKGKSGPKAEKFHTIHKCPLNHTKSSRAMEADGVLECFRTSVIERQLRYLTYIGDGDTKSYQNVTSANPYPGYHIEKAECVGHVQKRVGTRLRKFKSDCKDLMPSSYYENKKEKVKKMTFYLTHKFINRLQNYYGIAIRSSCKTSVPEMRKAVGAVLFHCSEAVDSNSRHQFCPKKATSWCKYQVDQINGTNDYTEKRGLPIPLRKKLEAIFRELSSPELLKKCMHGQTQNNNESINQVIWKRCPKDTYVGRNVVEMAVSSAVISFNYGKRGLFDIYERCNLEVGSYTDLYCYLEDASKVIRENARSSTVKRKRRKTLRSKAKGYTDKEDKEEEVPSYSTGAHHMT